MTIKNLNAFVENLWDWGFLDGCFPGTRIRVTDIDGLVERNGHFLLIEAKSPGKFIPTGQRILFDRLVEDRRWHVLVVWGAPNKPEQVEIRGHWGSKTLKADTAKIQELVRRWFVYANKEEAKARERQGTRTDLVADLPQGGKARGDWRTPGDGV